MENGAEAMKSTVEKTIAASNAAYKDAVEKSLSNLNEMNAASKRNLEAVVESVTAATRGVEALGAQAIAFSKKSFEDNVAAAQSMAQAKSIQEAIELQTSWAKTFMEAWTTEAGRVAETVQASVKDSLKPLNERVTATVERFQSAR